jgi:hypothetical protein
MRASFAGCCWLRTSDVAARPVEAGDEIIPDWVSRAREYDRYGRGCRLGRNCRQSVARSDHRHLTAYQIGCEVGQSIKLIFRPAILDCHTPGFDVPTFADALPKCVRFASTRCDRVNRELCCHLTFSERNEIRPPNEGSLTGASHCAERRLPYWRELGGKILI